MGVMTRALCVSLFAVLALAGTEASAAAYDFTISPDPPNQGQPATFRMFPAPPDGSTVVWDLDGEDEFEESGGTVTHTYAEPGTLTVRLRVDEPGKGGKYTVSREITVNGAPAVSFSFEPARPSAGEAVSFSPVVTDPESDPVQLTWSFGDGAIEGGTSPSHAYSAAGSYTVVVTARDAHGATTEARRGLTVEPAAGEDPGPGPDAGSPGPTADPGSAVAPGTPFAPVAAPPARRPLMMRPFPIVRIAGMVLRDGAMVRILSVRAPRGASVRVRCLGKGCPAASVARTSAMRVVRFHRFERKLRAGVRLKVFVRQAGKIGKYTRFLIRGGKPPARVDRCLMPGKRRPVGCP